MQLWNVRRLRGGTKLYSLETWSPQWEVHRLRDSTKLYRLEPWSIGDKVLLAVIWVVGYPLAAAILSDRAVDTLVASALAQ